MLSLDCIQVTHFWPEFHLDNIISVLMYHIWRCTAVTGSAHFHHRLTVLSLLHCTTGCKKNTATCVSCACEARKDGCTALFLMVVAPVLSQSQSASSPSPQACCSARRCAKGFTSRRSHKHPRHKRSVAGRAELARG